MIEVKKATMPAVQITLAPEQAMALGHMLSQYIKTAESGHWGTGTTVEADIKLAVAVRNGLLDELQS